MRKKHRKRRKSRRRRKKRKHSKKFSSLDDSNNVFSRLGQRIKNLFSKRAKDATTVTQNVTSATASRNSSLPSNSNIQFNIGFSRSADEIPIVSNGSNKIKKSQEQNQVMGKKDQNTKFQQQNQVVGKKDQDIALNFENQHTKDLNTTLVKSQLGDFMAKVELNSSFPARIIFEVKKPDYSVPENIKTSQVTEKEQKNTVRVDNLEPTGLDTVKVNNLEPTGLEQSQRNKNLNNTTVIEKTIAVLFKKQANLGKDTQEQGVSFTGKSGKDANPQRKVTQNIVNIPKKFTYNSANMPKKVTHTTANMPKKVTHNTANMPRSVKRQTVERTRKDTRNIANMAKEATQNTENKQRKVKRKTAKMTKKVTRNIAKTPKKTANTQREFTRNAANMPKEGTQNFAYIPEDVKRNKEERQFSPYNKKRIKNEKDQRQKKVHRQKYFHDSGCGAKKTPKSKSDILNKNDIDVTLNKNPASINLRIKFNNSDDSLFKMFNGIEANKTKSKPLSQIKKCGQSVPFPPCEAAKKVKKHKCKPSCESALKLFNIKKSKSVIPCKHKKDEHNITFTNKLQMGERPLPNKLELKEIVKGIQQQPGKRIERKNSNKPFKGIRNQDTKEMKTKNPTQNIQVTNGGQEQEKLADKEAVMTVDHYEEYLNQSKPSNHSNIDLNSPQNKSPVNITLINAFVHVSGLSKQDLKDNIQSLFSKIAEKQMKQQQVLKEEIMNKKIMKEDRIKYRKRKLYNNLAFI